MDQPARLILAIHSLAAGGAERVMTNMANYWSEKGWQIIIVTQYDEAPFYPLNAGVKHVSFGSAQLSDNILKAISRNFAVILKFIKLSRDVKPDLVVSFTTSMNILSIITCKLLNIPVIVSERYNPYKYLPGRPWRIIRRLTYPMADFVVVQSEQARVFFSRFCKEAKVRIIYNPVNSNKTTCDGSERREYMVLAVGRLAFVKGHDLLIKAFAEAGMKGWKLCIVGEGSERGSLERQINELGLANCVFLPGKSDRVEEYYHRASIFVLSSRSEGFPNCLLEAMSFGLPVVSTDCETGPAVIIDNGQNGILVPSEDISSLASAIRYLAKNHRIRTNLGLAAAHSIKRFQIGPIMDQWELLISRRIGL